MKHMIIMTPRPLAMQACSYKWSLASGLCVYYLWIVISLFSVSVGHKTAICTCWCLTPCTSLKHWMMVSLRVLFVDYAKRRLTNDHVDHSTVLKLWPASVLRGHQQRVKIVDVLSDWMTLCGWIGYHNDHGLATHFPHPNRWTSSSVTYLLTHNMLLLDPVVDRVGCYDRLGCSTIDSIDFIDLDRWVWQSTMEQLLSATLVQLFEHFETYRLSSSPLTTDKNALLTEQRAEVLPNIRGLDGAGSIPRVQCIWPSTHK